MVHDDILAKCYEILKANVNHTIGFPICDPRPSPSTALSISSVLSSDEDALLQDYDRFLKLSLERKTLEEEIKIIDSGQNVMELDSDTADEEAALGTAERNVLEAKARLLLKDLIVNSVLITKPVLKSIHSGRASLQQERDLLPYIRTRDLLSATLLNLTTQLNTLTDQSGAEKKRVIAGNRENPGLADRIKELETLEKMRTTVRTEKTMEKEVALKTEKMRWDTISGVIQGIIVGSGVNWAKDEKLRELVLQCGED